LPDLGGADERVAAVLRLRDDLAVKSFWVTIRQNPRRLALT
jgi:hypothetical protein